MISENSSHVLQLVPFVVVVARGSNATPSTNTGMDSHKLQSTWVGFSLHARVGGVGAVSSESWVLASRQRCEEFGFGKKVAITALNFQVCAGYRVVR